DEAVRMAVASGHGIGKSALVAWIILWALSTVSDTRGIVTANTEGQLRTKTWPELAKWHALSTNKDWFTYTATSLHYSALPGRDKTWRVDAITWSENNTEAIAGLHNKGKRAFALFDEASSIADGV
ncbi:MAG: terminase, partial [Reyranella sp.]